MLATATTTTSRIVIVGAGQSALWCARSLRMRGFGGSIVMIGDEPHPPYDRPPLSKAALVGEAEPEAGYYISLAGLAEAGIGFIAGTRALAIDRNERRVLLEDGRHVDYDHLVLATGARPRRLSVPGGDECPVHYLRTIEDCRRLRNALAYRRRVIVVGGGLIGLEVAAAAVKFGAAVHLLETNDRIMARVVGPDVSRYFHELHAGHGVAISLSQTVAAMRRRAEGVELTLGDGAAIRGDFVVAGIGVIPNDDLAVAAGLATADGVLVDEFCRTNDPAISAIGDVANHFNRRLGRHLRQETWQNAKSQGDALARILCGEAVPCAEFPWGWSDQFGSNLQMLGVPACPGAGIIRGEPAKGSFSVLYLKEGRLDAMVAVNAVRDVAVARRLIGHPLLATPDMLARDDFPLKSLLQSRPDL